jgi:hypothetical protein
VARTAKILLKVASFNLLFSVFALKYNTVSQHQVKLAPQISTITYDCDQVFNQVTEVFISVTVRTYATSTLITAWEAKRGVDAPTFVIAVVYKE